MRRKDREVTNSSELLDIINKCSVIRIAMVDDGVPYIVPLNFGAEFNDKFVFYMHSAKVGRKIDILKTNPSICFELDYLIKITEDEIPCEWSTEHESIIGYGNISFLEDKAEKEYAMNCIMKKYGYIGTPVYDEKVFAHTCVYKIDVTEIVGKKNVKS